MIVLLSKTGFDSDFNLRRWPYALVFREPPPTKFRFCVQEGESCGLRSTREVGCKLRVKVKSQHMLLPLRTSFFLSLSLSLSKKSLYLPIEHYYL